MEDKGKIAVNLTDTLFKSFVLEGKRDNNESDTECKAPSPKRTKVEEGKAMHGTLHAMNSKPESATSKW